MIIATQHQRTADDYYVWLSTLIAAEKLAALGGLVAGIIVGLTGMGDLILTCTGDLSRNRRVGLVFGGVAGGGVLFCVVVSHAYLPRMPSKTSAKVGWLWWLMPTRAASMIRGMG